MSQSSLPPEFPVTQANQPASLKEAKTGVKGRFRFSKVFTRWWWLGALLIIGITYTVSQIPVWMEMRGPLYESTALIEVKPIVDVDPTMSRGGGMGTAITRTFMNTQFEIMIAPATLELALAKSDLLNRLGGDKAVAMARMEKSTHTSQRRGTDLIEITYRDEDSLLARDAATAVYEGYKDRRFDLEMSARKSLLKAIKVELQNKSDRVSELRKRLMDVAEKVGLIYVETEEGGKTIGDVNGLRKAAEKALYEAQREEKKLTLQINKLLSVDDRELFHSCAELPDVGFKEAYKKYEGAITELAMMKASGLGDNHPDITMRKKRIEELKKSLRRRVVNVRKSIKHSLARVQGKVKKMRFVVNKQQDEGLDTARSMQELNVARKEYEMARAIKDGMEARYDLEKAKMAMPTNSVIVHQIPEQGRVPVTRGRDFVTALASVLSLPISIGLGILLMYIAEVIFPRKS